MRNLFKKNKVIFLVLIFGIGLYIAILDIKMVLAQDSSGRGDACLDKYSGLHWKAGKNPSLSDPQLTGENKPGVYTYTSVFDSSLCNGLNVNVKVNRKDVQTNNETIITSPFTKKIDIANERRVEVDLNAQRNADYRVCFWFDDVNNTKCGSYLSIRNAASAPSTTTSPQNTSNTTNNSNSVPTTTATTAGISGAQLYNPLKSDNLGQLMLTIMQGFIIIIAAWSVLFIIVGGFRMVMSQGNSEALTKAKATITWAIAGVIVSILAFSVVAIVQNLVGYKGIPTSKIQSNNRFV